MGIRLLHSISFQDRYTINLGLFSFCWPVSTLALVEETAFSYWVLGSMLGVILFMELSIYRHFVFIACEALNCINVKVKPFVLYRYCIFL